MLYVHTALYYAEYIRKHRPFCIRRMVYDKVMDNFLSNVTWKIVIVLNRQQMGRWPEQNMIIRSHFYSNIQNTKPMIHFAALFVSSCENWYSYLNYFMNEM